MHTISHLELCLAVLAVELAELIQSELDIEQAVRFFTDSCIMLGYVQNSSQRFYTYVPNRVAHIRSSTEPKQWQYVLTPENPADGTRPIPAAYLASSSWLLGPPFLSQLNKGQDDEAESFKLI